MTKWFDTNYHYLVPEIKAAQEFGLARPEPVRVDEEPRAVGRATRPVILGPVTFLSWAKRRPAPGGSPLDPLDAALARV